ncbi:hypothetical protein [Priestia megaterium]|uniref:hypothetical protein n=1 Tax=Priestia megaterium TaxID=1404 RepID=UPI00236433FA|nr:hypothetical protein [Priestia megaterium]MDD1515354.1 hypothetical protein [Priestia megaterium]
MLKKLFSFSNPVGLVITSATLILALSPEARRGTKKILVKGAGAALMLGDQMKGLTSGMRLQLGSFMEEAKAEREHMHLSDGTHSIKEGFEQGIDKVKEVSRKAEDAFKNIFDDVTPQPEHKHYQESPSPTPYNVLNDEAVQNTLNEIENKLH